MRCPQAIRPRLPTQAVRQSAETRSTDLREAEVPALASESLPSPELQTTVAPLPPERRLPGRFPAWQERPALPLGSSRSQQGVCAALVASPHLTLRYKQLLDELSRILRANPATACIPHHLFSASSTYPPPYCLIPNHASSPPALPPGSEPGGA